MISIIPLVTFIAGDPLNPTVTLPGETMTISKEEGQSLVDRKLAVYGKDSAAALAKKNDELGAIVDAIAEIPTGSYGKDGKPSVKAIQSIVDIEITAAQRDEAWQQFQLLSQS